MRRPRKRVPPNTVTVRPFVANMTQIGQLMWELLTACGREGPIRAIEQPINLARHDEVVLMQSFDLLGAQRDNSITPAEADVRVTAFCLGKLTKFGCGFTWHLSIKVLRLRECCGVPWRAFFFAVMGCSGLAWTRIAPI